MSLRAIDCQGLAGAFSVGTVRAGFDLVGKLELPGAFGMSVCDENRNVLGEDWEMHDGPQVGWPAYDDIQYVFGNPPCSGFSLLNTSKGANARGSKAAINDCMWAFAHYAARLNNGAGPDIAVFESVQQAFKAGRDLMQDLRAHVESATGSRYRLTHCLMSGASVGAAAIRRRYFWVIHRIPFGIDVVPRERETTYRDAIYDLSSPRLDLKWERQRHKRNASDWLVEWDMRDADRGYFTAHLPMSDRTTSSMNYLKNAALLPYWEPGMDYESALRASIKELGYAPGPWKEQPNPDTDHYGFHNPRRLKWDQPGYVITGAGASSFIHPDYDRWLTIRELARIQGFPDSWTFNTAGGNKINQSSNWIGKGVPVQSGQWLSGWVKSALEGNPGTNTGIRIGDNEYEINVTNDYKRWVKK